jgi:hypothetical protein
VDNAQCKQFNNHARLLRVMPFCTQLLKQIYQRLAMGGSGASLYRPAAAALDVIWPLLHSVHLRLQAASRQASRSSAGGCTFWKLSLHLLKLHSRAQAAQLLKTRMW